jgi:ATP-dependent protease ClpP protease subunit
MYDAIRSTKNKVITIACGMVGSAAVLPLMAGDERRIQKSAKIFLHDGSISMGGEFDMKSIKSLTLDSERINVIYNGYLSERTGLPVKKIQELCFNNTYLSAKESIKLGFVSSVVPYKKPFKKTTPKTKKVKKNARKR